MQMQTIYTRNYVLLSTFKEEPSLVNESLFTLTNYIWSRARYLILPYFLLATLGKVFLTRALFTPYLVLSYVLSASTPESMAHLALGSVISIPIIFTLGFVSNEYVSPHSYRERWWSQFFSQLSLVRRWPVSLSLSCFYPANCSAYVESYNNLFRRLVSQIFVIHRFSRWVQFPFQHQSIKKWTMLLFNYMHCLI